MTNQLAGSGAVGPKAGEKMEIPLEIDLSKIKNKVKGERRKKGKMKKYSEEDKFMMAGVQPESNSPFTKNCFWISATANFDQYCASGGQVGAALPMSIVPVVNPACFGFQPPNNWMP